MKKIDLSSLNVKKILLIAVSVIFIVIILLLLINLLRPKSSQTQPKSAVNHSQKSNLAAITYTKQISVKNKVKSECVGLCPTDASKSATISSESIIQSPTPSVDETSITPPAITDETILDTSSSPSPTTEAVQTTQPPISGYIQNTLILASISFISILIAFVL